VTKASEKKKALNHESTKREKVRKRDQRFFSFVNFLILEFRAFQTFAFSCLKYFFFARGIREDSMISNQKGLTLIELVIATVIGLLVLGIIYDTYRMQQGSRTSEQLVVDMEQNVRAALTFMRREIRMANYQPRAQNGVDDDADGSIDESDESVVQGLIAAQSNSIRFSLDLNADGDDADENETITYGFFDGNDADSDGIADQGAAALGREPRLNEGYKALAYDVHAIAFAYAFDNDGDGQLDTSGGAADGNVIWAFDSNNDGQLDRAVDTNSDGFINELDVAGGADLVAGGWVTSYIPLSRIRAVQIWILGRTRHPVPAYRDTKTYVVGPLRVVSGDHYKRCLLTGMVYCRNMGT
jgi:type IV pilus assembly protein PilW